MHGGAGFLQSGGGAARPDAMEQEQRGDRVAGAVHRHRQARRAQQVKVVPRPTSRSR